MDDKNQLSIELNDAVAEGTYSNLAVISHSNQEFVLDFIRIMPNMPKAKVKSRIILSPQHAKRFVKALEDNIRKYEDQHGPIAEEPEANYPQIQFSPGNAEA